MQAIRKLGLVLGAAALVAACGGQADDGAATADPAYAAASPDFDGVSIELAGDDGSTSDGALSSPLTDDGTLESPLEDAPALLPAVRNTVKGINTLVAHFVRRIEALVRTTPDVTTGTTHSWTQAADGVDYQFTMTRTGEKHFTFTLDARLATDTTGEFKTVLDGENFVGTVAHRGAGNVRCDLTALNGLDAAKFPASGELKVVFAHTAGLKRLKVHLTNFKKDPSAEAANAAYVFTSAGRGTAGAIKLAIHANLNAATDTDKTAAEWLLIRGRWLRHFAARFDGVAFGGDFPAGAWARLRECLAADDDGHAVFSQLVYHPATGASQVWREVGTAVACAPGLREDPPAADLPEDQTQAEATSQSDADIDPPADP